jgi:hypothetical protein
MKSSFSLKILIIIFGLFFIHGKSESQVLLKPVVRNGVINISSWDFEKNGSIELNGDWLFYWDEIITPNTSSNLDEIEGEIIKFPGAWTDYNTNGKTYPSLGFATYRLNITGCKIGEEYALKLPDTYCSYQLYVSDSIIAKNGKVGESKDQYQAKWIPQTVSFTAKNETETLTLNISNFDHVKGGIKNEIWLGSVNGLTTHRGNEVTASLISVIGIGLLSLLSILGYLKYSNKLFIHFAVFCLIWSIRGLFSNIYLMYSWFPDFSWIIGIKIEYLTIYTSVLIGYNTFSKLFPEHSNKLFSKLSVIINSIFIIITLLAPAIIFTMLLNTYFVLMGIALLYMFKEVIKAYIYDEKGAGYISMAIALLIVLFFYDMLSYYKFLPFNPFIISIGYVLFYGLLAFSLHYNILYKKEPETYKFSY